MATTFLSPICNGANFTVSGVPASGYKLFTYTAGTTTKQTTYQDNAAATPNANPIILSSQGYPSSGGAVVEIWLTQGVAYKFVLAPSTDTDPPTSPVWTRDNISGVNDTSGGVSAITSEWIIGTTPTFISTTSFSVVGDQRSIYQVNRRVKTTNSGGTVYSTIVSSSFGAGVTTITVVNDSSVLDAGLSSVSYGILSTTNPSFPVPIVDVQTFTASGTWTKPSGPSKTVEVIAIGGGGPGGGGRGGAGGSDRTGGGGGGGGSFVRATFSASDLTPTVVVTVATSTSGGAGGSSANGTTGAIAGNSSFGAFLTAYGAAGGAGGGSAGVISSGGGGGTGAAGGSGSVGQGGSPQAPGASNNAQGSGGQGGNGGTGASGGSSEYGGAGGGGGASTTTGNNGGGSIYAGGGGGGGGGVTAGNAECTGGAGGASGTFAAGTGGTAGAANGGSGGVGANGSAIIMGSGGGGGGGQDSGTGGAGGNGGAPGGGGGGGGAGTTVGGAGGNGGRGEVRVYTYF